nr:hypothetical protein CFP56_21625 [Quercus suber]
MAPHISVRESIKWVLPGGEASEPTSTLVLTSSDNYFVDVRIFKASEKQGKATSERDGDVLPAQRLEWAFAGTSTSEWRNDHDGGQIVHCTWKHFVDSKHSDATGVIDEGDMFPQSPPHADRTLERGRMVDPTTGRMTDYEEVWTDVVASKTLGGKGTVTVVVLRLCDENAKAKGMVVRVGQFVQGVVRVQEEFACERWEWEESQGWKRKARVGDLFLPCGAAIEACKITLGGKVKYGAFVWEIIELIGDEVLFEEYAT